ncbi:TPA: hypothetical protein DHW51_15760 [Candidatus Poribacteria bacterium]|nr:hypothetical protein [Candidatus Poribacteria bacterium]
MILVNLMMTRLGWISRRIDNHPTYTNLVKRFSIFAKMIKSKHTFVFYFSGHGMILRWVVFSASSSNSSSVDV